MHRRVPLSGRGKLVIPVNLDQTGNGAQTCSSERQRETLRTLRLPRSTLRGAQTCSSERQRETPRLFAPRLMVEVHRRVPLSGRGKLKGRNQRGKRMASRNRAQTCSSERQRETFDTDAPRPQVVGVHRRVPLSGRGNYSQVSKGSGHSTRAQACSSEGQRKLIVLRRCDALFL